MNYLLDQATSNSAARTYSYRSEEHDLQQPQETLATNTSSSHSRHGSIDPTVAALLEQMQRMQTQQAELQEKNAELLQAALTRPITVQQAPKMNQLPPIRSGPQGEVDIQRFEAHMTTYAIPAIRWATELKALLRGDLVSVAMSLPPDKAADYAALKRLLLTHMGVSQSTRFSNWLDPKIDPSDTMTQMAHRLLETARACVKNCSTVMETAELVTMEILYKNMNPQVANHVRSQKPKNLQTMADIADDHITECCHSKQFLWKADKFRPRQQWASPPRRSDPQPMQHLTPQETCPKSESSTTLTGVDQQQPPRPAKPTHRLAKYFDREKGPMCFQCKNWGHIGAQCPESRVLHATSAEHPAPACVPALYAMGEVFNSPVRLLLDSGADHLIVCSNNSRHSEPLCPNHRPQLPSLEYMVTQLVCL